MHPLRWVGDVDQSEFDHACQSTLSLNYPYDNDLCQNDRNCLGNITKLKKKLKPLERHFNVNYCKVFKYTY